MVSDKFFSDTNVLGIDPGLTGAIAQWDGAYLTLLEMITIPGKTRGRDVDWDRLIWAWDVTFDRCHVFLERVNTRPGEGRSSAFKFGSIYGGLRGILAAKHLPTTLVTPVTWKRHFGLKADKREAVELAVKLFPNYAKDFYGPKGGLKDGCAEAALIAYYGLEKLGEKNDLPT